MSGNANRLSWVDTAKGLSIILVVMMHSAYGVGEETGQAGILHWITLGVLITLPIAIGNCRIMEKASIDQPSSIADLDVRTAQLQLAFGGFLSALILVSAWL